MKRLVVYYTGIWTERLLTVERFNEVAYFVDDIDDCAEYTCLGTTKQVYPVDHLADENPDELVVIVSDNKRYATARERLQALGLEEQVHFFNGWNLELSFYKSYFEDSSWESYEDNTDGVITQANYEKRARIMSHLIPDDVTSVMDMGCGAEFLRKYLRDGVTYYGLDFCKRNDETIVCDLNRDPVPDIKVDLYYMAGLMYYIDDPQAYLSQLTGAKYLLFDYGGIERYLRLDGVPGDPLISARNNFVSIDELLVMLRKLGFVFEDGYWNRKDGMIGWHMYLFKNTALA